MRNLLFYFSNFPLGYWTPKSKLDDTRTDNGLSKSISRPVFYNDTVMYHTLFYMPVFTSSCLCVFVCEKRQQRFSFPLYQTDTFRGLYPYCFEYIPRIFSLVPNKLL